MTNHDINYLFPKSIDEGVGLEYSEKSIRFRPVRTSKSEAKNNGDGVTYDKVFGKETILKYAPTYSGIKEEIILNSQTADTSFEFIMEAEGLLLFEDERGYYLAENKDSELKFYLGKVILYDATGNAAYGSMEIETIENALLYRITVVGNEEFLGEAAYPVTIDPDITVFDDTHGANAIIDAPIFSGLPNSNFGAYQYNRLGTPSAYYGIGRTVVKWPGLLNSSAYASITSDNQIQSAYFYVTESSGLSNQIIDVYPLGSNRTWTESNITWNNKGTMSAAPCSINAMNSGQVTGFDMTALVKSWVRGYDYPTAGFIMMNRNEANNESFFSCEYTGIGSRPYVVVNYTENTVTPPVISSFDNAQAMSIGTEYEVAGNSTMYYSFTPSETGIYTFESNYVGTNVEPSIRLFNSARTQIAYRVNENDEDRYNFKLTYHLSEEITYYVAVGSTNAGNSYNFKVRKATSANEIIDRVGLDESPQTQINAPYQRKIYKFTPDCSGYYLLFTTTTSSYCDSKLWIYNSNMNYLYQNDDSAFNMQSRIVRYFNANEIYYIVADIGDTTTGIFKTHLYKKVTLPSEEIVLYNSNSQKYMSAAAFGNGSYLIQKSYNNNNNYDVWKFERNVADEYKINLASNESNYYIRFNNNGLETGTTNESYWRAFANSNGEMIFENTVYDGMVLGSAINDQNAMVTLQPLGNNTNIKWRFYVRGNVQLVGQQMGLWCWAASTKMMGGHYSGDNSVEQSAIVELVKRDVGNYAGSMNEAIYALNHKYTNVPSDLQAFYSGNVGGKENLLRYLNQKNVLYFRRTDTNDNNGHASLITGYNSTLTNSEIKIMFIISDPWPVNYRQVFVPDEVVNTSGQEYEAEYDWIVDSNTAATNSVYYNVVNYRRKWNGYIIRRSF